MANTCFYEMSIIDDDENFDLLRPPKEKIIFEIYHGDDPDLEHKIIRIVSYPDFLSMWELTEAIMDYCKMYLTDDPAEIQKTLHRLGI